MVGIKVYVKTKLPLALDSEMQALARLAEVAADHPDIVRIVAFGSRVRGDFHGASDLDKKDLAAYRLEKADIFLNDAKTLLDASSYGSSANRSYYAMLSAARSLLILRGISFPR